MSLILALCAPVVLAAVPDESPVADAAMRGDTETVRSLLKKGADVNVAQGDGMTALHWAAVSGVVELAEMLIYAGANLEAGTRIGSHTALHLASKTANAPVVATLLEAGSDANATTTTGGARPLHFAAASGSAEAVTFLLAYGAEVNATESAWGQTPLMFAAANNRVDAINVLLREGGDVSIATQVVDVPAWEEADRAARKRRDEQRAALRALEEEGEGEQTTETEQPAEAEEPQEEAEEEEAPGEEEQAEGEEKEAEGEAVEEGEGEQEKEEAGKAEDELERPEGKPPTYAELVGGHGGLTALHYAAREGHVETVLALLESGADIDQVSEGDHTSPLLIATINGHFDLAMLLLERGANPNLASAAGATPLYAALNVRWAPRSSYPQQHAYKQQQTTYLDLMEALLEVGADPNARLTKHLWYTSFNFDHLLNSTGATSFWRAAYALDVEAMCFLVAHGADPKIATTKLPRRRRGPQYEEEKKEDLSGVPPVPVGGPAVYPLHAASGAGYGEGFAANFHRHVPEGWLAAVKYIVEELGADVNARDHNAYTPLHHAAARGDIEMILYLVSKGADVTAVSRKGQTTADMANGPVQRIQPFTVIVALLENLGSKNNHNCVSC